MRSSMNIEPSPPRQPSRDKDAGVGIAVTATMTSSRPTPNPPQASPPVGDVMVDDKAASKTSPFNSRGEGAGVGVGGGGGVGELTVQQ